MERYDGKTRKDDVKKYILIGIAVLLVILLYQVLTGVIYKVSHPTPDIIVLFGAATVTDYQEEDDMEALMERVASDLDRNGNVVVDVVPYDTRQNSEMAAAGVTAVGAKDGRASFYTELAEGGWLIVITHEQHALNYYFKEAYMAVLPEELAEPDEPYRVDISGCPMLEAQGLESVAFYAGIKKDATPEEYEAAVEILQQLKKG